jgi:XTP/dITP diphosphohydrolase
MQPFIVATQNKDKIKEIREILSNLPFTIMSMEEAGFSADIEESGATFAENALIKARAVHQVTGGYVMADDSGLSIDALSGAPGIYSARFYGKDSTYEEKINALWELLKDVPLEERTAHFICAVAVVMPDGSSFTTLGKLDGIFYDKMLGSNGFGYDPVFYIPERGLTTAQMTSREKHAISHRGKALQAMLAKLEKM